MFAYPSGHAHVGHVRNYIIGDVVARMKRMRGFNVLHPFGWDAFGLPAENAAIKNGTHPETSTLENIAHMKGQLQRLGISYAWEREIATCLPEYYTLEPVDLPEDVRARPGVPQALDASTGARAARRCSPTSRSSTAPAGAAARRSSTRELEQWFFRITQYADELLDGIDDADRVAREGPDDAAELDRAIGRRAREVPARRRDAGDAIEVFTTRIDTIYGATFVLLAPEHPLVERVRASSRRSGGVPRAGRSSSARRIAPRGMTGEVEKEGFDTGRTAINPFTGEPVPIWVANFVLASTAPAR